jgi:hypothetical protein
MKEISTCKAYRLHGKVVKCYKLRYMRVLFKVDHELDIFSIN